jgi:CRP-like cAMP-binding protein
MEASLLNGFKERLNAFCPLSEEAWEAFIPLMSYIETKGNKAITRQGSVEDNVYYILDGGVRVYSLYNDKEVCTGFSFADQFSGSVSSFITRRPSQYTVATLVPSKILGFSHKNLNWMYRNYPELNTHGRMVMEYMLVEKRQRELDILFLTAEERYMKLLVEHPTYALDLPLKYVASFLGITSESLSRIRNAIINKV